MYLAAHEMKLDFGFGPQPISSLTGPYYRKAVNIRNKRDSILDLSTGWRVGSIGRYMRQVKSQQVGVVVKL
jgi:hypothetical protein